MTTELRGVIPITATPFDAAGHVDEEPPTPTKITALRRLPGGDHVRIFGDQQGIGLALRKELLRLRGAIATSTVRQPGPVLDDVTRQELGDILARLGILEG